MPASQPVSTALPSGSLPDSSKQQPAHETAESSISTPPSPRHLHSPLPTSKCSKWSEVLHSSSQPAVYRRRGLRLETMLVYVQALAFLFIWLTYGRDTRHTHSVISTVSVNFSILFFSGAYFYRNILPIALELASKWQAKTVEIFNEAAQITAHWTASLLFSCPWSLILNGILSALLLAIGLTWLLRFREARARDPGVTFWNSRMSITRDRPTPGPPRRAPGAPPPATQPLAPTQLSPPFGPARTSPAKLSTQPSKTSPSAKTLATPQRLDAPRGTSSRPTQFKHSRQLLPANEMFSAFRHVDSPGLRGFKTRPVTTVQPVSTMRVGSTMRDISKEATPQTSPPPSEKQTLQNAPTVTSRLSLQARLTERTVRDIPAKPVATPCRQVEHDDVAPRVENVQNDELLEQTTGPEPVIALPEAPEVLAAESVAVVGEKPRGAADDVAVPSSLLQKAREGPAVQNGPIAPLDDLLPASISLKYSLPAERHSSQLAVYEDPSSAEQIGGFEKGGMGDEIVGAAAPPAEKEIVVSSLHTEPPRVNSDPIAPAAASATEQIVELPAIPEQELATREPIVVEHDNEADSGAGVPATPLVEHPNASLAHLEPPSMLSMPSQEDRLTIEPSMSSRVVSAAYTALREKKRQNHTQKARIGRDLLKIDRLHEKWIKLQKCGPMKRFPAFPKLYESMEVENTGLAPHIERAVNSEQEIPDAQPLLPVVVPVVPIIVVHPPVEQPLETSVDMVPTLVSGEQSQNLDIQMSSSEENATPQNNVEVPKEQGSEQYTPQPSNPKKRRRDTWDVGISTRHQLPKIEIEKIRAAAIPVTEGALRGATPDVAFASILQALKTSSRDISAAVPVESGNNKLWVYNLETALTAIREYAGYARNTSAAKGWRWPVEKMKYNDAVELSEVAEDLHSNLGRFMDSSKVQSKQFKGYQAVCQILSEGSWPPPEFCFAPSEAVQATNPLMAMTKANASSSIVSWLEEINQQMDAEISETALKQILQRHFGHIAGFAEYEWHQNTRFLWQSGKITTVAASRSSVLAREINLKLGKYKERAGRTSNAWINICRKHCRMIANAAPTTLSVAATLPVTAQTAPVTQVTPVAPVPSVAQAVPAVQAAPVVQTVPVVQTAPAIQTIPAIQTAPVVQTDPAIQPAPAVPPPPPTPPPQPLPINQISLMTLAELSNAFDFSKLRSLAPILTSNAPQQETSAAAIFYLEDRLRAMKSQGNASNIKNLVSLFYKFGMQEVLKWGFGSDGRWDEGKAEICIARRLLRIMEEVAALPSLVANSAVLKWFEEKCVKPMRDAIPSSGDEDMGDEVMV